jgi:hypothetical protein
MSTRRQSTLTSEIAPPRFAASPSRQYQQYDRTVESLPMAPERCSLSADEPRDQIERYRTVGESAQTKRWAGMRVELVVRPGASRDLVKELVETEQRCCPFFRLDWRPEERYLSIAVSSVEHQPALELVANALGIPPE